MESEITLTDWHAAPGEGQGRARWGYWSEGEIRVRVGRIWEHQASWAMMMSQPAALRKAWWRTGGRQEHSVYACVSVAVLGVL